RDVSCWAAKPLNDRRARTFDDLAPATIYQRKQVTQFFHLIEKPIEGICSAGPRPVSVCCVRPSNACGCSHGLAQNDVRALALKTLESATCPSNLTSPTKSARRRHHAPSRTSAPDIAYFELPARHATFCEI